MAVKCPKCDTDNPSDSKYCKECATPLLSQEDIPVTKTLETPREELTTGSTFAERYQIIEVLGKGGMGKVYKVLDKEVDAKVALKLIRPEVAAEKKTIERFRNELKMARDISHKNVCRMYHLGKKEGTHYITMEYVPGEDLKSMIRMTKRLSIGTAIDIAKQVCHGLAEAHRLGVVHRDLKPSNIMIDKEGNAKVMDFGIARSLKAKGITGTGMMIGTPEYMSPEQVEGKEVDQRSDIYSLGIILYEMVTGRVPFEGETPFSVALKHKGEIPKDPRELNIQVQENLNQLILKCMEKDREKRYQTAEELLSELNKIEKSISVTDRIIPKRKYLASKKGTIPAVLKKLYIATSIVIVIAVVAIIILQLLPKKEKVPTRIDKPSLAIMFFENNTGDENLDHLRKSLSDLLIADLLPLKQINVLRGDQLVNILSQLDQLDAQRYSSNILKQVARLGGASYILQGNYSKSGEKFRINIMLHEAETEELIFSERIEGKEDIFAMADDMSSRIRANLKLFAGESPEDIEQVKAETSVTPPVKKELVETTTSAPTVTEKALSRKEVSKDYYSLVETPTTPPVTEKKSVETPTTPPIMIKVVLNYSSLKESPRIAGKTLARLPLNTVLKAEEKTGQWFKVKWEKDGVQISGFIHELNVELADESLVTEFSLEINSDPREATIKINGEEIGLSPKIYRTTSAKIIIEIEKKGYKPIREEVSITQPITKKKYTLEKAGRDLEVKSKPTGASVFLDGKDTEELTNCVLSYVPFGKHMVKIVKDNYSEWEGEIDIQIGEGAFPLAVSLTPVNYQYVHKWGGPKSQIFKNAAGVAVDSQNNVYITSEGARKVQRITSDWKLDNSWGNAGKELKAVKSPGGVAIDNQGNVYVTDTKSHCVFKFDKDGKYKAKWGEIGTQIDKFITPLGIATDSQGNVYVVDSDNSRVKKYNGNGELIRMWGRRGASDGDFVHPKTVAVSPKNDVYVLDGNRVQKFTSEGTFVAKWGKTGSTEGAFKSPMGMYVDKDNFVYIADSGNNRILKFDENGKFIAKWGSKGTANGQMILPIGIAVDSRGYVYVVERDNNRLQLFEIVPRPLEKR